MKSVSPYLNFPGNTEEAFTFYRSVFGGEFAGITRYRDMGGAEMGMTGDQLDAVANMGLPIGNGVLLMGTDVMDPEKLRKGNNFYITLETDTKEECTTIFNALADGGTTEMALQRTEWAEQYGSCADRFGVQWMVMFTGSVEWSG